MLQKPVSKSPVITIVASPGVGKTTLAGLFPKPVFMQSENASTVFEGWEEESQPLMMPRLPRSVKDKVSTLATALEQIRWLITNEHDRETLVIDSVSTLNEMFEHELCVKYDVDNVADAAGGFHKGFIAVAEMHGQIRSACEVLRDRKNMTIVFLSHLGIQKIKSSPETDEYSVYTLAMGDKSTPHYVNHADVVAYIKKDQYVTGKETNKKGQVTKYGKITDTGDRQLITSSDGRVGYINAKTRYPIPPELKLDQGENPFLQYVPFFASKNNQEK